MAELRDRPYEFDIQVQLCVDLAQMPVEDVTVEWPEALSPFVTVAKLRIPQRLFEFFNFVAWDRVALTERLNKA